MMLSVSVGSVPAIVSFLFKEQHEWSWKFYVTPLYWEKQTVSLAVGVIIFLDILIAVGKKKRRRRNWGGVAVWHETWISLSLQLCSYAQYFLPTPQA